MKGKGGYRGAGVNGRKKIQCFCKTAEKISLIFSAVFGKNVEKINLNYFFLSITRKTTGKNECFFLPFKPAPL